ncbi:MAG: SpoIIE family protein phosphatase [Polyangiaceae bacterium]|nr:SpoIIE family protein phosphatase [Polyangiaceae bacterium]
MSTNDSHTSSNKGYVEITRSGVAGTQRHTLDGSHLIVGRNPQAQIVLDHTTVSRSHAELVFDPFGRWWVHDLRSTNGTYVNGTPVEERLLNPGDVIGIGDFTLRIHIPGVRGPRERSASQVPISHDVGPPLTSDDDATLITVLPQIVESPQINASHLTTVMALGRKLMSVEDPAMRLRTLCEFVVGSDFPGDSAVTIRMRDGKPTKVISGPFLRDRATSIPGRQVSIGVLKSLWETREPVLGSNGLFATQFANQGIRKIAVPHALRELAVVACPLDIEDNKIDVLYVEFPPSYGSAEWLTVVALAAEAFQQAELVWDMRRHVRQSAFVERDLQMARQIQDGLVPRELHIEGLDVAIGFEPCRWVGGDYVDAVPMPDGRVLLAIADVCGKGLQAALVASSLHTMVHATIDAGGTMSQLMDSCNNYLCSYLPEHSFVTMMLIAVQTATGEIEVINAGHPPAFAVNTDGRIRHLQSEQNVALGMMDSHTMDIRMEIERTVLDPDEVVMLYSDGLTELEDENQVPLGEARLSAEVVDIVRREPRATVEQYRERVIQRLKSYRGSKLAADDSTFLVARRPRSVAR